MITTATGNPLIHLRESRTIVGIPGWTLIMAAGRMRARINGVDQSLPKFLWSWHREYRGENRLAMIDTSTASAKGLGDWTLTVHDLLITVRLEDFLHLLTKEEHRATDGDVHGDAGR